MLVLSGIAVIALGFLLRFNPLLVVAVAAGVTGIAAGLEPLAIVAAFGKAFNDARYVTIIYIVLPVIGLLERAGHRFQWHAHALRNADHRQAAQYVARIASLVARRAQAADQALALVEVQRRYRNAAAAGHVAHAQFRFLHCLTSTMVQVSCCVLRRRMGRGPGRCTGSGRGSKAEAEG